MSDASLIVRSNLRWTERCYIESIHAIRRFLCGQRITDHSHECDRNSTIHVAEQHRAQSDMRAASNTEVPDKSYAHAIRCAEINLLITHDAGQDTIAMLTLPGAPGPLLQLTGFPLIAEFRLMLTEFSPHKSDNRSQVWRSSHLYGFTSKSEAGTTFHFEVNNVVTLTVTSEQWLQLGEAFSAAWRAPELFPLWKWHTQQYGER